MSVYFYHLPIQNLVKIGTSKDVEQRINQLSTGCTEKGELIRVIPDLSFKAERWLHEYFAEARVKGEWFTHSSEMLTVEVPEAFQGNSANVPYYSCIQTRNRHMTDSRDVLMTFTKNEAWFFWSMDKAKDIETNEVLFSRADCPEEKIHSYPQVIAGLIAKNVIIRTKQNHYIINPNVTLPKFDTYKDVLAKWESLGGKPLTK